MEIIIKPDGKYATLIKDPETLRMIEDFIKDYLLPDDEYTRSKRFTIMKTGSNSFSIESKEPF